MHLYMVDFYKDIILNIVIIFSPLALYPYIQQKTKNRIALNRSLMYILFAAALVTTMSFPINLNGLIYDFRLIPLTIGSLYGGWQVSILLYVTLITYRYLIGSPNDIYYLLSLLPSIVFLILFLKKFDYLRLIQKIIFSILVCTLIKMLTFTLYLVIVLKFDLFFDNPWGSLATYVVQGVIVGLCVYLIELLNKYFYMQEEIIKSEKMKIVGDMAASVAHEIRNPLTTVRGFIHLLSTEDLSVEKKDFYRKISFEELNRAELIISDYLALAKPDLDIIETININEEITYLSNVLLTYANYNNIQINVFNSKESALHVKGDRNKCRQALINIGKNAIEAMQDGGILELRVVKRINDIVIVISDSGIGMTAEQVKRLGTPYYSTKEKGTGLGTMVSFSIIKKMDGKINIKSEVGVGTEFKLIFPMDN